jgi:nucleoside-diphosphate-sugar epimerase
LCAANVEWNCDVRDVADAHVAAAINPAAKVAIICGGT